MALVIVERHFDAPIAFEEIQSMEDRGAWCLETHGVVFVRTYFSTDRTRMLCVYEAPDAEAVRTAQATIGMPFERVWAVGRVAAPG